MVYALAEAARERNSTVVVVNRPLCPVTTVFRKPGRVGELFGKPRLEKLSDRLFVYSPRYVIHDEIANRIPVLEKLNLMALRHSYRHLQKWLGIAEPSPLIWFNYPHQGYVRHLFPDSFCIFELYDNLADNTGRHSPRIDAMEAKMRERVDLLLTTSQKLQEKYAGGYRRSMMFGNGLTRRIFESLSDPGLEPRKEILDILAPRLGYAGMLSERMDWNLIGQLAALEPQWNFVFAGHIADPAIPERMKSLANIHFMGEFSHAEIPSVLRAFDLGLLPYLDNPFFHYLNPLKFYEMAAAGLASISTNIDELRRFPDEVVRVVPSDPEKWRTAIKEMLESDPDITRQAGVEVARRFIWEDMTAALLDRLQSEWL